VTEHDLDAVVVDLLAARATFAALWHVTAPKNVATILTEGLRADEEGQIFAITHPALASAIARDQVFIRTYALLRIDPAGISPGRIGPDLVAEYLRPWHRVVRQPVIEPRYLTVEGRHRVPARRPTPWDYVRGRLESGQSVAETEGLHGLFHQLHLADVSGDRALARRLQRRLNRRLNAPERRQRITDLVNARAGLR
jgi:hypothetical protein